ncbi:hypothetical protein J6590_091629 [Homalodisca vitripennis]|nr:hypothetical protein J6590_091629 [Homalodisca vitripennis]
MEASSPAEQEYPGNCPRPPMMREQPEARVPLLDLVSAKRRIYASITSTSSSQSEEGTLTTGLAKELSEVWRSTTRTIPSAPVTRAKGHERDGHGE